MRLCVFFSSSCHAEGKHYKADLDLCNETVAEKSRCSVKGGEALISLEKKKHESWARLLTQKVSRGIYNVLLVQPVELNGPN